MTEENKIDCSFYDTQNSKLSGIGACKQLGKLCVEETRKTCWLYKIEQQLKRKEQELDAMTSLNDFNVQKLEVKENELEKERALKETYYACYKAKHGDLAEKLELKEQELKEFSTIIRNTQTYSEVCSSCGDDCKAFRSGYWWGKEDYTDTDTEIISLKQLIKKEQECEKLRSEIININSVIEDIALSFMEEPITSAKLEEAKNTTIVDIAFEVKELKKQLKQVKYLYDVQDEQLIDELATENKKLKQECEGLKAEKAKIKSRLGISSKTILQRIQELTDFRDEDRTELIELQHKLNVAKEALKYYSNSKIGKLQPDGIYRLNLNTILKPPFEADNTISYDPRFAQQALKEIGGNNE